MLVGGLLARPLDIFTSCLLQYSAYTFLVCRLFIFLSINSYCSHAHVLGDNTPAWVPHAHVLGENTRAWVPHAHVLGERVSSSCTCVGREHSCVSSFSIPILNVTYFLKAKFWVALRASRIKNDYFIMPFRLTLQSTHQTLIDSLVRFYRYQLRCYLLRNSPFF